MRRPFNGQIMATILPEGKQSFTNSSGDPLAGGKLYTYAAGTSTPKATYADSGAVTPNANPIVMDARGEATIFWDGVYKVILKDSADSLIWSVDNISSTGDSVSSSTLAASGGSALFGFIQSGTGAGPRTGQAKMRETVSVTDFYANGSSGAMVDPTGVVDSTGGFNAALLAGKSVYVPAGTYLLASSVVMQQDGNALHGDGDKSILNYTGSGTAVSLNAKLNCAVENLKIASATAAVGIYCGLIAHYFRVYRVHLDGQSGGVPTGFTSAAIVIEKSYYGEISGCDIAYGIFGIAGLNECNGNFILANSIRQCKTGIQITDTTSASNGNAITGNEIESSAAGSRYGIEILGSSSNAIANNRVELTAGTAHIFVNSGVAPAYFNNFFSNFCEGSIATIILGDGVGSNQVYSTQICGGRGAFAVTINQDCIYTRLDASPSSYGGTITDNGYGTIMHTDPSTGMWYERNYTVNSGAGHKLTIGGAATILDTGGTNYLDIKGPSGTHTRFETSGALRAVAGVVAAGGDTGGIAGTNALSSVVNSSARSTGVGTIKFADATARDCAGMLKIYIGTTAYYVPYFVAG